MTTTQRRPRRKVSRRFSSASLNGAWDNAFAALNTNSASSSSSTPALDRGRQPSKIRTDTDSDVSIARDHKEKENKMPPLFHPRPGHRPLTYASLPPSPLHATPRPSPPQSPTSPLSSVFSLLTPAAPPFSIWDYLREELLATDFDSHQEMKWERVSNFLSIPVAMEKVHKYLSVIY